MSLVIVASRRRGSHCLPSSQHGGIWSRRRAMVAPYRRYTYTARGLRRATLSVITIYYIIWRENEHRITISPAGHMKTVDDEKVSHHEEIRAHT